MTFKEDRLENEKNDPEEASSFKFINVPLVLLALFLGFGITYLALKTDNANMVSGDSRTKTQAAEPTAPNAAVVVDLATLMEKGKQIYTTTCQACHQPTGAGIPGAFPPLAESEWVNGPAKRMIAIILHGIQGEITVKGQKFKNVMPAFQGQLEPEDIAAVATYVRNSFGNKADLVTPELAAQVKEDTKSKGSPWGGEAELNAQSWE
jgi:mono/diheme cytochrome c family protein